MYMVNIKYNFVQMQRQFQMTFENQSKFTEATY